MTKPSKTKPNAKNKSKAKKTKAQVIADAAEVSARCDLSQTLLQAYENEYADKTSSLENIERKGRAVMVIAGIMLAAGMAFVGQLDASISSVQQWLLVGVIATLLFTLWQCARALKIINEDTPPTADFVRQLGTDALQSPDKSQLPALVNDVRYDLLDMWSRCNSNLAGVCGEKTRLVARSQSAIMVSAFLIAAVTGLQVLDDHAHARNQRHHDEFNNTGLFKPGGAVGSEPPGPAAQGRQYAAEPGHAQGDRAPIRLSKEQWEKEQGRSSTTASFRPVR